MFRTDCFLLANFLKVNSAIAPALHVMTRLRTNFCVYNPPMGHMGRWAASHVTIPPHVSS